ncbi:CLC2D protein, partial [Penelope pileata]|nr:CLC2D protein [Penelope pileata]
WLGFRGKCFYFSAEQSDWDSSREHCTQHGASLATIGDEEELGFLLRQAGAANRWIGLHRAEGAALVPWSVCVRLSVCQFELGGGSPCAYVNRERVSSSLCHTRKRWICSRAHEYTLWRQKL